MASSNVPHPPGVGISLPAVKLNDTNYLLWSRAIKKYLTAQAKEKYLTDTKPADDAKEYQKWVQEDAMVTTWLWNCMEPSIATSTMWVDTTKELWDSLQDRFGRSKNISRTSSSPFGSSISEAKPLSSAPTFGLNSATSLSEANSGSGTALSVFGSSWQAPKSTSLFGSTTYAPFQFSASASSVATNSALVFGSSSGAPSGSLFPFTSAAAPSSQPVFGNPSSVNPFGTAPLNNNDQIGMEDSMTEDTIQALTPTVPAFGQQPITLAVSGFAFNMPAQPNPFQFSGQQNVANPQNSTIFQSSNSLEFNAATGGSFPLGSGGGDKSNRRIVKIKSKQRRK